jgi:hypothetical protein
MLTVLMDAAPGLYTSPLPSSPSTDILIKPSLLPYPSLDSAGPAFVRSPLKSPAQTAIPISVVITQWHWLLLYSDRIVGVSRETEKVVWDEALPVVSVLFSAGGSRALTSLGR